MYVHNVVGTGSDTPSTTNRYNKDVPKSTSFIPKAVFGLTNDFAAFANLGTFTTGGGTWCHGVKQRRWLEKDWLLKKVGC